MTDTAQGGSLARTHEGKPGLPRGRSRLPTFAVRASQRERLEGAVVAAGFLFVVTQTLAAAAHAAFDPRARGTSA